MNVLEPDSRQPPSTLRARVCIDPKASLPAPGSVSAQAPILSMSITGRAKRIFWSSVPRERMAPPHRPSDAPKAIANPGQKRDSSIMRMAMSGPSPGPASPERFSPSPLPARACIFAKLARTMSGTPNVAQSSRMSG